MKLIRKGPAHLNFRQWVVNVCCSRVGLVSGEVHVAPLHAFLALAHHDAAQLYDSMLGLLDLLLEFGLLLDELRDLLLQFKVLCLLCCEEVAQMQVELLVLRRHHLLYLLVLLKRELLHLV